MKKSSSIDNPFFRLMGAIGDLVVLNILWLLCCLPVVTAGASTLALFAIVHKIAAGEDYRISAPVRARCHDCGACRRQPDYGQRWLIKGAPLFFVV